MTDLLKQLVSTVANKRPAVAATNYTVYTVPAATTAMLSRIVIANISPNPATVRIAIVPSGQLTSSNVHWVAYDIPLGPFETINFALGAGMATGDFIDVNASLANSVVFSPFGLEVT